MALSVGFVYVLSNCSMPGIVKIGYTTGLSEDRARYLYSTSVPTPFDVEYRRLTSTPAAVERRTHELLSRCRVSPRREFFSTDVDEAAVAVEQACLEVAGIKRQDSGKLIILHAGDSLALTLRRDQLLVPLAYAIFDGWQPEDIWQVHADGDLLHLAVRGSATGMSGFSDNDVEGCADPVPYLNRERDAANWPIVGREHLRPGNRLIWLEESPSSKNCDRVVFEFEEHCQLVCRTRTLGRCADGLPLILNNFTAHPSPAAVSAVRAALTMAPPRVLNVDVSRSGENQAGQAEPVTPTYWLPQLEKPQPRSPGSRRS